MDKLPLEMVAKAKDVVLNTQRRLLGVGILIWPMKVVYCSHSVRACMFYTGQHRKLLAYHELASLWRIVMIDTDKHMPGATRSTYVGDPRRMMTMFNV